MAPIPVLPFFMICSPDFAEQDIFMICCLTVPLSKAYTINKSSGFYEV